MENQIREYAKLVIKLGQAVTKGQAVVIRIPTECRDFAKLLTEYAYEAGASEVFVEWNDEEITRLKYLNEDISKFETIADHFIAKYKSYIDMGASFISVSASDPEGLKGVDGAKLQAYAKAYNKAMEFYSNAIMADKNAWTVISVPTTKWAKKVFPEAQNPVAELWTAILKAVRCDLENPIQAWEEHLANLDRYADFLNEIKIDTLHFKSELGTDLKVQMPKGYLFVSGGSMTPEGKKFVANMPTEEVFSLPKRDGVDGVVYSSKPLNYQGNLIDQFMIEFKAGKAIKWEAKQGEEFLTNLINSDEGSAYLGEVALVSYNTPISLSNILYYNTLFDENASCHLALGRAYPTCLEGGSELNKEEFMAAGGNESGVHVDFMFGTKEMEITALTADGKEINIFKEGNFCI